MKAELSPKRSELRGGKLPERNPSPTGTCLLIIFPFVALLLYVIYGIKDNPVDGNNWQHERQESPNLHSSREKSSHHGIQPSFMALDIFPRIVPGTIVAEVFVHINQTQKYVFSAFAVVVWYNALELIVLCLTTFKHYHGCYFWSLFIASIGLIPHVLGFLFLFFFPNSISPYVAVSLIIPSWYAIVTGNSLVLWSRLHLLLQRPRVLRAILAMIIIDAVILHIPTTVLLYGAVSSHPHHFTKGYEVMERIQLIGFAIQESILSIIYIVQTVKILRLRQPTPAHRRIFLQLLAINIVIVILDLAVVGTEYAGYYAIQVMFKPVSYSIKFKLEYAILGRLIRIAKGVDSKEDPVASDLQPIHSDPSHSDPSRQTTLDSGELGYRRSVSGMSQLQEMDTYASMRFSERHNL